MIRKPKKITDSDGTILKIGDRVMIVNPVNTLDISGSIYDDNIEWFVEFENNVYPPRTVNNILLQGWEIHKIEKIEIVEKKQLEFLDEQARKIKNNLIERSKLKR